MNDDYPILNSIQSITDFKKLSIDDLPILAHEIRRKIPDVLVSTGGHLSSNLGIIELTLALHHAFASPKDKFIFDVGHQVYTHKLITGRNNQAFSHIRQDDGLSGFTNPQESIHDLFYSGHAGNAFSLGLGLAEANQQSTSQSHIIPILGDAAFSCGLTLEALNNIPPNLKRFIIILNDNKMSISENAGSISKILRRLINNPTASKLANKFENLLKTIPCCGQSLAKKSHNVSSSIKNLFSPVSFFEQFGLSYIGPIDGHNIKKMVSIFNAIKDLHFPIIIHTYTVKGKGLDEAQANPSKYHGVAPQFKQATTSSSESKELVPLSKKDPTFPQVFGNTIYKLAEKNSSFSVITPAMSIGSCLEDFRKYYPERFYDVGIAEGHAVTFSGGLAKQGNIKAFCIIYSTFLLRALDNIFHDVCLQNIPVIFAIDRAGLAFADGHSHQGIYDISFLRAMPNLILCQPRDGTMLQELVHNALEWNCPVAIRYPNATTNYEPLQINSSQRKIGKGEILSHGEDFLIIALGHMCSVAHELRNQLLKLGITCTIVDPIFIKPLDKNLLSTLLMTHSRIITIEEHSIKGGLAAEINEFLATYSFKPDILNFAVPDQFFAHGNKSTVLKKAGLDTQSILKKILIHFNLQTKKHYIFKQ